MKVRHKNRSKNSAKSSPKLPVKAHQKWQIFKNKKTANQEKGQSPQKSNSKLNQKHILNIQMHTMKNIMVYSKDMCQDLTAIPKTWCQLITALSPLHNSHLWLGIIFIGVFSSLFSINCRNNEQEICQNTGILWCTI